MHTLTYIVRLLCTLTVVAMAVMLSLLAGSIGLHDTCGLIIAAGAVILWAIAIRLTMPHSLYWLAVLAPLVALVVLALIFVGLIYWG